MNKDPTKELASMLANGWKVASLTINNDGTNSAGQAVVYVPETESWCERNRRRQAEEVKEDYREVQEDPIDMWNRNLASAKPLDNNFNRSLSIPHIESRILW